MTYAGRPILVLGCGRSGRAAIDLLLHHGAAVTVYDRRPESLADLPDAIERITGTDQLPDYGRFDRVIVSPGIPVAAHPKLLAEVDLAAAHLSAPIIGVTGTNGKSTTTVLIGQILRRSGMAVPVGGNLGDPLCALVDVPAETLVAELSSFQLEWARELRVRIGVLLNLAPDHLERHGSLQAYAAAKANLTRLQRHGDTLVTNLDDVWARETARNGVGRTVGFSTRKPLDSGAFLEGKEIVLRDEGSEVIRISLDALSPACRAPIANTLAALLAAHAAGGSADAMHSATASFEGLPHRCERVCTRAGVHYIDDSKATNPAAAAVSLATIAGSAVWIVGGRNKGLDFAPLAQATAGVRCAVVFGESAGELSAVLEGVVPVRQVETLDEAVLAAAGEAQPGDSVLLAPACSSLDAFESFAERGRAFAERARALPEGEPC